MALGGAIAATVAVAPLVVGSTLLDMIVVETDVPALGTVKAGTALVFDLGVTLIVVGMLAAVLDALGVGELGVDRPVRERT